LVKSLSLAFIRIMLLAGTLALAACASGTSTGVGSSSAPTAAPKAKPTALPTITMAFCQGILTVAEANQIMQPAQPATTIRIDAPSSGAGSCNYEYAPYKPVVSVVFLAAIPASEQGQPLSAHIPSNTPGMIINTPVSGVGDQAQYVAGSIQGSGQAYNIDVLDVMYGAIIFDCNHGYLGTSAAVAEQATLTKACQLVVSRL
jgi:hypothetical protein